MLGSHYDKKKLKLEGTDQLIKTESSSDSSDEEEKSDDSIASLKVLRWKFVQHKMNRALGLYSSSAVEDHEKLDLVNRVYSCFLQAMEYHP